MNSNETSALPETLANLAIDDNVVTIDAMHTQTRAERTIRECGALHLLCVKHNQAKRLDSIMFAGIDPRGPLTPSSMHEVSTPGHGLNEKRRCWAYDATYQLYKGEAWEGVASFALIERVRANDEHTSTERPYCISSLPSDAARIARAVRIHSVGNRLHWSLDVQFNDDWPHVRSSYAANNFAFVRHIVMSLLRRNTSHKTSIKTKRSLATPSGTFGAELLGVMT